MENEKTISELQLEKSELESSIGKLQKKLKQVNDEIFEKLKTPKERKKHIKENSPKAIITENSKK